MRLITAGGFVSALSAVMSLGEMELSASTAASSAGCACARSRSASDLTAAISSACGGGKEWQGEQSGASAAGGLSSRSHARAAL